MKKIVCIILAVVLAASLAVSVSAYSVWPSVEEFGGNGVQTKTSEEIIAEYAAEYGIDVDTNRYYFLMPDGVHGMRGAEGNVAPSWYNDYAVGAGVYWWGSAPGAAAAWAGYVAMVEDQEQSIYYVDMPTQVVAFIWNNGIDGTMDPDFELYTLAAQTVDVASEYPDPGELDSMPEGADSFDNCIFIIDPDAVDINPMSLKQTCGGTWYFYYGVGCFGIYSMDSDKFTTVEDQCCNPDHFDAEGNHVGFQGGEDPQPQYLRGDYDGDNEITIMDATRVQNIQAKLVEKPDDAFLAAVDADGDGELTIMDATRIQNVKAKIMNMDGSKPYVEE